MKVAFFVVLLLAMASVIVDAFVAYRRRKAMRDARKVLDEAIRECDKQIAKWENWRNERR